jgi:cytochrome c oxidase cbb3-type subunit 4
VTLDFDTLAWFAQSFGLIYLLALSLFVLLYAYWPSNRRRFDGAARSIFEDEDEPWR